MEQNFKIYLKDSDRARLANKRIRIVRETSPLEPCDNEDLVFEKAESFNDIPNNKLKTWYFAPLDMWFFTTAERCKTMVSKDPSYWTDDKLSAFAKIEKQLYNDWNNGNVYGIIIEEWNARNRSWTCIESYYGMYGATSLIDNINDKLQRDHSAFVVCIDDETMKYDFNDVEMRVNEFKDKEIA